MSSKHPRFSGLLALAAILALAGPSGLSQTKAAAQSAPDIVWVGSGESTARNSVAPGDGVYKSEDAGERGGGAGGYPGAPTQMAIDKIEEAKAFLAPLQKKMAELLETDVPALNKLLLDNKIPFIKWEGGFSPPPLPDAGRHAV